jgi:succinate dehydrogenase flavin-adding protein (antitoxin of CptAB toxin-antitoxin module)
MLAIEQSVKHCFSFYYNIDKLRKSPEDTIINMFAMAYGENQNLAIRTLLWSRDVKGAGERRVFKICLKYLAQSEPNLVKIIIDLIPSLGRWDDMFCLIGTPSENAALSYIKRSLKNRSLKPNILKWFPNEKGANSKIAKRLREYLHLNPKEYRKLKSSSSSIETSICKKDFNSVDYSKVNHESFKKYFHIFLNDDTDKFNRFLKSRVIQPKEEKETQMLNVILSNRYNF